MNWSNLVGLPPVRAKDLRGEEELLRNLSDDDVYFVGEVCWDVIHWYDICIRRYGGDNEKNDELCVCILWDLQKVVVKLIDRRELRV